MDTAVSQLWPSPSFLSIRFRLLKALEKLTPQWRKVSFQYPSSNLWGKTSNVSLILSLTKQEEKRPYWEHLLTSQHRESDLPPESESVLNTTLRYAEVFRVVLRDP